MPVDGGSATSESLKALRLKSTWNQKVAEKHEPHRRTVTTQLRLRCAGHVETVTIRERWAGVVRVGTTRPGPGRFFDPQIREEET